MKDRIVRPSEEEVCKVLKELGYDPDVAPTAAKQYVNGWDAGRKAGREEAQRHLRLLLGIDTPTFDEAAYWSAPFPLARGEM